ncbi:MAG: hypothetical protein J6U01_10730 [Clostridia bacterium]|nr:hypothetical protein [Clostridia bacterium]
MDREKVIKGLEHCTSHDDGRDKFGGVGKCGGCPYYGHDCTDRMKKDAIALLQEQEHKDKMFHALEDDWKQLKKLLNEQNDEIKELRSMVEFWKEKALHT